MAHHWGRELGQFGHQVLLLPHAYVTASSDLLPEFREFERMSTTVVNAFIGPKMGHYLERFRARVR